MIEAPREEIVLFGFSVALLNTLRGRVSDGSVLVVEEPDVAQARGVDALAAGHPSVARVVRAEYQDPAGLDRLLSRERAIARAAAVVPGSEYAVVPTAVVAERIGVRGAGITAARVFRDKFELRELTSRAGIRNPAYRLVHRIEDAERFFLEADGKPCVLKPTARQASAGVQIITALDQIRQGWQASAEPSEGHRVPGRGVPSRLLFEHALAGPEYSVELLVIDGRTVFRNVTAKRVHPGRFPVEIGHTVPAVVTPRLRRAFDEVNDRLVSASRFRNGILHSEWIVTHDGPALVECAARMPGDDIGVLISQAWGFDLSEAYVRLLLGEHPHLPDAPTGAAAIAFLLSSPGRVTKIEGLERARSRPGVQDAQVAAAVGAVVSPVTSSWDRVGHVRTRAPRSVEAQRLAQDTAAAITITVQPAVALVAR